jgi:hypothetical protein
LLEYYAALAPWAVFNANRKQDAPFIEPFDLMLRRRARIALDDTPKATAPTPTRGRPALLLAPVPATGMRYAVKGERPPSKYAPGENDGVIERYDAYAKAFWSGGVKRHGR